MTESDARRVAAAAALAEFMKGDRMAAIGELGVAAHLGVNAGAAVERAQVCADEAVAAAIRQGRELVEAARERARDAALTYQTQYRAALDVGWHADELERMGYASDAGILPVDTGPAVTGSAEAPAAVADPADRRVPSRSGPPRVSFSGLPGVRPPWPPISPRRDIDDGKGDRSHV